MSPFEEFVLFSGTNSRREPAALTARPIFERIQLETGAVDEDGPHNLALSDPQDLYKIADALVQLANNIMAGEAWGKHDE